MSSNPLVTSIQSPQFFYEVHSSERFKGLCRILDQFINGSAIIFCRTKKDVDHISEKLTLLNYAVASYHGDLSPTAREKGMNSFKDGLSKILVLTDIPTDIKGFPDIDLVLFSIIPQDPDSYIQRIIRLEASLKVREVATLISSNEIKKIAFIKRVTKSEISQKKFMTVKDLISLKQVDLHTNLKAKDQNELDPSVKAFTQDLLNEFDPVHIISFLLENGTHGSFSQAGYDDLNLLQLTNSKKNELNNSTQMSDVDHGQERLFIAIGKTDDVDDEKLKEFLFIETNIEKSNFSEIKIFETFSFFVVSSENADIILEIFRRKKRGKRSIVERAKGKDSKRKT
ncbi:MAG: DEAD/DEAH box helicase [Candidatus Margulisiibacteriota bacterium]